MKSGYILWHLLGSIPTHIYLEGNTAKYIVAEVWSKQTGEWGDRMVKYHVLLLGDKRGSIYKLPGIYFLKNSPMSRKARSCHRDPLCWFSICSKILCSLHSRRWTATCHTPFTCLSILPPHSAADWDHSQFFIIVFFSEIGIRSCSGKGRHCIVQNINFFVQFTSHKHALQKQSKRDQSAVLRALICNKI